MHATIKIYTRESLRVGIHYHRGVFTGREHGCPTRVRWPCSRAPAHTTREYGPSTRVVCIEPKRINVLRT